MIFIISTQIFISTIDFLFELRALPRDAHPKVNINFLLIITLIYNWPNIW